MLKEPEKWRLVTPDSQLTDVYLEVNWNPDDEKINQCQVFKLTYPDGNDKKSIFIGRKQILEILFACGKPEDQQKMIPQTLETIHHYKTVLGLKATKDISKGEMMNFPIDLSVPCAALRQDVIGSLPKEYQKGKFGNGKMILPVV